MKHGFSIFFSNSITCVISVSDASIVYSQIYNLVEIYCQKSNVMFWIIGIMVNSAVV